MGELGPGVIGKDQLLADGKQRRPRPREPGFIDFEQPRSEENVAARGREQTVHFVHGQSPLQQKQVDGQRQRVALCQALVAINGNVAPMEIGNIGQPEALPQRDFAIPGVADGGNRLAQGGHIGIIDQERSRSDITTC